MTVDHLKIAPPVMSVILLIPADADVLMISAAFIKTSKT